MGRHRAATTCSAWSTVSDVKWLLLYGAVFMESLSNVVSQHIPWFWGVLAWSLAILGLLAIAAIPAYFLFYPISTNVRRGVASYLSRLVSRQSAARDRRRRAVEALIEDFKDNAGITYVSERLTRLDAVLVSFSKITKKLKPQLARVSDLQRAFERASNKLTEAALKAAPAFPNLPTADQLPALHGSLRTAKARLFVSSMILIALISVNTGMLGQILRDLGFIPHDLTYFGIPLYLVFAFMLTLVEAGLGYVHTAGRPTPDEPSRVALWPLIASCFAVVMACVEGFFYSQVAPSRNSLVDLPIGQQIKQGTLFFLWGATLVLVLFGLGAIWSASLERIAKSADHLPALIRRLWRYREKYDGACSRAGTGAGRLREEVEAMRRELQAAAQESTSLVASVTELKETATSENPEDAVAPRQLTTAEAHHFTSLAGMWFMLTFLSLFIVTVSGLYAFVPYIGITPAWLVSVGLAACFLILGLLLPRGELLLDGTRNRRLIVSGALWKRKTAVILAAIVLTAFGILLWRVGVTRYQAAFCILMLVLCGALSAAASQASATGKGLRIWFRLCVGMLFAIVEEVLRLSVRIFLAATFCLEVLALALAAPAFLLRGREVPPLHAVEESKRQTFSVLSAS
ncbi:MAG: hypothetical protein DMG38_04340 [Acidobacteria bacterium]|nr:MAG: hypothetical protein DMG38_04340 [Acidobacteriota bacterium]